ncbi:hypothetical protein AB833_04540 [Chromatiales bacterium (ex Bugula neritina AB1)]|nr:hypothetical protein AB833_04540 [Chromatiales bacterium (ex Bugula neritina AB1)]
MASAQIADTEAPVVIHRQPETAGVAGELQTFLARVSDDIEVSEVTLYYRQSDKGEFASIPMRVLLDTLGEYMIAVESSVSDYPGFQYYIEAVDTSGNRTSRGFSYAPMVLPLEQPVATASAPAGAASEPAPSTAPEKRSGPSGWLIGLGALLLLGALGGGGGGGSDSPTDPGTVTLTIVSDGPTAN